MKAALEIFENFFRGLIYILPQGRLPHPLPTGSTSLIELTLAIRIKKLADANKATSNETRTNCSKERNC